MFTPLFHAAGVSHSAELFGDRVSRDKQFCISSENTNGSFKSDDSFCWKLKTPLRTCLTGKYYYSTLTMISFRLSIGGVKGAL